MIAIGLIGATTMFTGCDILETVVNTRKTMLIGELFSVEIYNNSKNIMSTQGKSVYISPVSTKIKTGEKDGKSVYSYENTSTIEVDIDGNKLYDNGNTIIISEDGLKSDDIQQLKEKGTGRKLDIYDDNGNIIKEIVAENISIEKLTGFEDMTHIKVNGYSCYINNGKYLLSDIGLTEQIEKVDTSNEKVDT